MDLGLLHELAQSNTTKIVLCSLDGLGGLPRPATGKSELWNARLPQHLAKPNPTKLCLCPLDGLGGLPRPATGKSELETARLPNLHALAARSACGLLRHVGPGITPGSGPGHLGLFGYDPLEHPVGRGVLEALGIDFHLTPGDRKSTR